MYMLSSMRLSAILLLSTFSLTRSLAQETVNLLVGTYTNGSSKGIYSFKFNQNTGSATPVGQLELSNPSYLSVSKNGKTIYAVSEDGTKDDAVSAIAFDRKSGEMHLINKQLTYGEAPCYVESNGKMVFTANYTGGSLSAFPISKDGSLQPMKQQFFGEAHHVDSIRQDQPHIHTARILPGRNTLMVSDFSADRLLLFHISKDGSLTNLGVTIPVADGTGPRHIEMDRKGHMLYVLGELSGEVTVFGKSKGLWKRVQTIASDEVGGRGSADIHLSSDGRFLYTSNRLKNDGIAIFAVNKKKGTLQKVGYQKTGIHPRNFNITPNGKFLLCACRDSNIIQVFEIDKKTGLLKDTHQDISVDKAVCVKFVR